MTGLVPSEIASSYQMSLRIYFTTGAEAGKVVGLYVLPWAIVDASAAGAGIERSSVIYPTELTSGSPRDFQANQIGSVAGTITIKTQNGDDCSSDCHNRELAILIQPSSSMTISTGSFYLVGYRLSFTTP